jgi:hypothetical protein
MGANQTNRIDVHVLVEEVHGGEIAEKNRLSLAI